MLLRETTDFGFQVTSGRGQVADHLTAVAGLLALATAISRRGSDASAL
jgi:hypothetical protein